MKLCLGKHTIFNFWPGGVLRFAVVRGRADFQGRLFDPGCKFGFQLSAGPKNILDRVQN